MTTPTQPIHYISALRILATFLVILIHASTGYLNVFPGPGTDWHYANLLNSFSRFSVPLFVMISGTLLLQKRENFVIFYKKRMARICWPFLFWVVVYLVYYFYRYTNIDVLPAGRVVEISIQKIVQGPSAHLWFLYMIIGLYIAIPFLQIIVAHASRKELLLFIFCWIIALLIVNKDLNSYIPRIDLTFFSGYVGYLILGYYLSTQKMKIPVWLLLAMILVIAAANTYGTYAVSLKYHKYMPTFYGYLGLNNALLAAVVFLLFKKLFQRPLPKWLLLVDGYSFGIYLVHILVLNYVHPLVPLPTVWKIPVATCITLIGSFAIIYLLRKIPYGKYVSG
ncbi:acyltransferase [Sphingobacterium sp. LRF_L2]|uniref:acyltransferase n=1 Tax=Sphingobacterium sp. LRF_L2 TaxID=3369421 RepID=UPI003F5F4CD1